MKNLKIWAFFILLAVVCLLAVSCANDERHTHQYDDLVVVEEPSCTKAGIGKRVCSCGESYKVSLESKHTYSEVDAVNVTCTTDGFRRYICTACQDTYEEVIAHKGHQYISTTIEATCTEDGVCRYACSVCQDTYEEVIAHKGHQYTSTTVEATCMEDGVCHYICSVCQDTYDKTLVSRGYHSYRLEGSTQATCTQDGALHYVCYDCRNSYDEPIARKEHNYELSVIPATCTEDGYYEYTCSRCLDSYTEPNEGSSKGHSIDITGVCTACDSDFSVDMTKRLSAPTFFKFDHWAEAWLSYRWHTINTSGKTIKSIKFLLRLYDATDEVVWESTITYKGSFNSGDAVEVVHSGAGLIIGSWNYTLTKGAVKKVEIPYVAIEYEDGTVESGYYGYSTTETF